MTTAPVRLDKLARRTALRTEEPTVATERTARLLGAVRPTVAVGLVVLAYHHSLRTLFDTLRLDTPLAHLGLVPAIAGLIALTRRRPVDEPDIHDRQLDYIVGLPLLAAAVAVNALLPDRLSTMYWVWRIDLLTLPLFVSGVIAVLFGLRTLWRFRAAVAFLFLAWPWPFAQMTARWLNDITTLTINAVKVVVNVIPVATAVPGGDGSQFNIVHDGVAFPLSVGSACSGANSLVGFLLIGTALQTVVSGRKRSRLAWLAVGAVMVWVLNVVRIVLVFAAAEWWGERVAIDGLHPFVGIVIFALVVLVMVLMSRWFGLQLRLGTPRTAPAPATTSGRPPASPYRPRWRSALAVALVATLGVGAFNSRLSAYDLVADSLGSPRLTSFEESLEKPQGWQLSFQTQYDWSRRYFGSDSAWRRYSYVDVGDGPISSNAGVVLDVIDTSDRAALNAYGVVACYNFHEYRILAQSTVDLGGGVEGGLVTWRSPDDASSWTTLFWHWPIKDADGGTRYERMTLLVNDGASVGASSPELAEELADAPAPAVGDDGLTERQTELRAFIIEFGRALIVERAAA
jgi:exosortase/archaeosortase family protein